MKRCLYFVTTQLECAKLLNRIKPDLLIPVVLLSLCMLFPLTGKSADQVGKTVETHHWSVNSSPRFERDEPPVIPPRRDPNNNRHDWRLNLTVESGDGDYKDMNNIAGVNQGCKDGYDFVDAIEFTPHANSYVQLYFPHPDWEILADRFSYDFRSRIRRNRTKTWEFTVKICNLPNREFEIKWNNISEIHNRYVFKLFDDDGEKLCNLRRTDSYQFKSDSVGSQEIKFSLRVKRRGRGPNRSPNHQNVEDRLENVVNQFGILSVNPNPFNQLATIHYEVQTSGTIALDICNVSGRSVRSIYNGHKTAGRHDIILNAADLPAGLYYIRLDAGRNTSLKKVMLIK